MPDPKHRRSAPGLPPYQPQHSGTAFAAARVATPLELEAVVVEPAAISLRQPEEIEDRPESAAVQEIRWRAIRDHVTDLENRMRLREANEQALWNALAEKPSKSLFPRAIDEWDGKRQVTVARALLAAAKWLAVALIGAAIAQGVRWWLEPKPQNPPVKDPDEQRR